MFRLKECIEKAKAEGTFGNVSDFATAIWSDSSSVRSARVNLRNLVNGVSKRIDISSIPFICEKLGVSADYLFGLTDTPSKAESNEKILEHARAIIKEINNI